MNTPTNEEPKIKKIFEPIIAFLKANQNLTVEAALPQALNLARALTGGEGRSLNTSLRHPQTNAVIAIKCSYHQKWELVDTAPFGSKASSSTGLNNVCKEGHAAWSRQQNAAKAATAKILPALLAAEIEASQVPAMQAEIEATRSAITPREDGHGYDNKEDCPMPEAEAPEPAE